MDLSKSVWLMWGALEMVPRTQPAVFFSRGRIQRVRITPALAAVSDETHPESPDKVFFGGAVQLNGQKSRVPSAQKRKQGFL